MNVEHEVVSLLEDLIAIKSVNPEGKAIEDEDFKTLRIARFIGDYMEGYGFDCEYQDVDNRDLNCIIRLDRGAEKTLLYEAHMDTVQQGKMEGAFNPRTMDGKVYGRGACDDKGSLAAMLIALRMLKADDSLDSNVIVACTANEEHGYTGVLRLIEEGIKADGAVVGEPTELNVIRAHKGVLRWFIETRGVSAHSAKAHLGKNAIYRMTEVIVKIKEIDEGYRRLEDYPRIVGPPTINVAVINGGSRINVVPESCEIQIDRRIVPGEDPHEVWEDLRDRLGDSDVIFRDPFLEDSAMLVEEDSPIVRTADGAVRKVLGNSVIAGVPYGTDASKLERAGIPSVVLGPGSIDDAHSVHENVSIDELVKAVHIYRETALRF